MPAMPTPRSLINGSLKPIALVMLAVQLLFTVGGEQLHSWHHQLTSTATGSAEGCCCHCQHHQSDSDNPAESAICPEKPFVRCMANDCLWHRLLQKEQTAAVAFSVQIATLELAFDETEQSLLFVSCTPRPFGARGPPLSLGA